MVWDAPPASHDMGSAANGSHAYRELGLMLRPATSINFGTWSSIFGTWRGEQSFVGHCTA